MSEIEDVDRKDCAQGEAGQKSYNGVNSNLIHSPKFGVSHSFFVEIRRIRMNVSPCVCIHTDMDELRINPSDRPPAPQSL